MVERERNDWRVASACSVETSCVQVRGVVDGVLVRDRAARGVGPVLSVSRLAWSAFAVGVAAGEFGG